MDYVTDQYPPKFIRSLFDLSEEQINAALTYIEANRTEVEAEYQKVLKETEELRLYYEEQNRERVARIATLPPPPGLEAAWEKLQAAKARHQLQA
jgi:ABC-type nitrate/sulfonate/bicarbonate transport system substrate-binding protein